MPLNYSRWKHRITFSLSPVTTVNDRWVSLLLPWRIGINPDYSDIRFTDTKGNSLDYNIASKTDRITATVKIEIPIAGIRLIHLYSGNSQAESESTAAGTEDANPVLTAVSGTMNPGYSGVWTLRQGGRLNQQKYARSFGTGPYPEWKYKTLIQITNPVSQANYQHKLTLKWHPGMRSDFRDIRFAQFNGKRCDYWIESYTSRTSAVVWIEVPTAGQRWLNLFYGNGRAGSESSGANTFDFFDDFTGSNIDTSKWTATSGVSVSSGICTITRGASAAYIYGKTDFGAGYNLRYKVKYGASGTLWSGHESSAATTSNALMDELDATYCYPGSGTTSGQTAHSVSMSAAYRIIEITRTGGGSNATQFSIDGVQKVNSAPYASVSNRHPVFHAYGSGAVIYVDFVAIRKYAATEPTLNLISHQPNSTRITPYETIGTQQTGGNTYIMDPIEATLSLSGSMGATILQPLVSAGLDLTPSAPITILFPLIEADLSLSGSVVTKNYIPLDTLDLTQISVSKAVTDDIWAMNATIDGYTELNTDVLRHATFSTTDHLGVTQSIFAGILPKGSYTIKDAANKTVISGYDYAWYLARQQVQSTYQHNVASVNPADIITGLLGGDDWEETTGIMPYKINQVTAWGDTLNNKVFDFAIGTTKKQAIEKICAYCRFVFLVKWIVVEGIATAAAYFISEDDIDTELDLPTPVTFTYPDPYLADSIKPVVRGDERYNRVTVIGRNNAGGVFFCTVESPAVTAGDELPIEKIENSGSWTTQEQVNARAQELFEYYSETAYTFTAKAIDRMDLELLQKIKITGYTGVSENWMRITRIKKTVRATKDGVEKTVDIEFTENVKWSALRRMYRYSSDDMTSEVETIVDDKIAQIPGMQVGTCTAIDGQAGTVVLESGEIVTTRVV
ncbi:DUF2341 domain-containing protein [Methanospirillum stamsii]|uniref:DUF2341 domain-containing protein n=1 Tax=Methanospirillum stamsii TaxID=1277351 RepID=A0A2V2NGR2_9EURY|nr:DUF2341 domain-containing protein [Methanospirillum stamsii]PWR74801.1 hypothetical protein DLD82_07855 [Methanospirillum stamsii]